MTRALVIGGGICGPVAAMALKHAGLDASVFEAQPFTTAETGSYLTVASNGLDALRAIDAEGPVMQAGFPTTHTALLSGTGKRLATVAIGATQPRAIASHTMKRAHLHRALHDAATRRGVRVELRKRLVSVDELPDGVRARFDDGTEARGEVLIGCDGVHSVVRRIIDPDAPPPRYVGLLNFGGYTGGIARGKPGVWQMVFGRRAFFGHVADPYGGTAWFANVPRMPSTPAERAATTADRWKEELMALFAGDRGPAVELIERGVLQLAADNTHDLASVPRWHRGRLVIIGDAAHAPSPSSGQGASMAIEDAVLLAKCLRDAADHQHAFAAFERLRRPRVERIVAQGARSSSSKALGPIGRTLRDLLLPAVFRFLVTDKSLAWMFDHHIEWTTSVAEAESAEADRRSPIADSR